MQVSSRNLHFFLRISNIFRTFAVAKVSNRNNAGMIFVDKKDKVYTMSVQSLDGLVLFLQNTLSEENQRWVASRLARAIDRPMYSVSELEQRIASSNEDIASGRVYSDEYVDQLMDNFVESHSLSEAV